MLPYILAQKPLESVLNPNLEHVDSLHDLHTGNLACKIPPFTTCCKLANLTSHIRACSLLIIAHAPLIIVDIRYRMTAAVCWLCNYQASRLLIHAGPSHCVSPQGTFTICKGAYAWWLHGAGTCHAAVCSAEKCAGMCSARQTLAAFPLCSTTSSCNYQHGPRGGR